MDSCSFFTILYLQELY